MSEELNIDKRIKEIDESIEQQEMHIKRAEALKSLNEDERFKLLIYDGYFQEEYTRMIDLLTSPRTMKAEDKEICLSQIESIKNMIRYFGDENYAGTVAILGENAKKAIDDMTKMKQELLHNGKEEE